MSVVREPFKDNYEDGSVDNPLRISVDEPLYYNEVPISWWEEHVSRPCNRCYYRLKRWAFPKSYVEVDYDDLDSSLIRNDRRRPTINSVDYRTLRPIARPIHHVRSATISMEYLQKHDKRPRNLGAIMFLAYVVSRPRRWYEVMTG